MMITRYDGGYLVKTASGENLILTDEELRVAKMAERDWIRPMHFGERQSDATTRSTATSR